MQGCLIITNKCHLCDLPKSQFFEKLFRLDKFTHGISHGSLFCFCTGKRNHILLLPFPGNYITSNQNTIAKNRPHKIRAYITCISIPYKLSVTLVLIQGSFSWGSLDIFYNANNCIRVIFVGRIDKLTYHTHNKRDIRASNSEVIQFFNKSFIPLWVCKRLSLTW